MGLKYSIASSLCSREKNVCMCVSLEKKQKKNGSNLGMDSFYFIELVYRKC